jgi:hypothetical protein
MKKLHLDGILESNKFELFDKCKSCLKVEMTVKTPFVGHIKQATRLLDIIHTDVSSPLYIVACGGFF